MKDVIGLILGGGVGTRLYPLTRERSKPAVPLAGKYRLIDIPISNCLNSGIEKIAILTQFKIFASLHRHISRTYTRDVFLIGTIQVLRPQSRHRVVGIGIKGQQTRYVNKCLRSTKRGVSMC